VSFARLRVAHWVVFVAAVALLFTTAVDWYSTKAGEEARRVQEQARPADDLEAGQTQRELEEDAGLLAEGQERNAWAEDGLLDRLILICLLGTSALGVATAFWRAHEPATGRTGIYAAAGSAASATALLVLYRILQEPGVDEVTTVQVGAPLALGVLGVLAFAAATALREEPAA
jgi:hypothetical protein